MQGRIGHCGGPECVKKQGVSRMEDEGFGFLGDRSEKFSGKTGACSALLDLAASDDLIGFKQAVEEDGSTIDEAGLWYSRSSGGKMGSFQRTPLMIAALFGSTDVLKYIISTYSTCGMDVNYASPSDGATALHCAAATGSSVAVEVVKLLIEASANLNFVDAAGNRPGDLIIVSSLLLSDAMDELKSLLNVTGDGKSSPVGRTPKSGIERKEYTVDPSLPDIKNGIYSTDEFRMYVLKVKPCSRAYSHDWTECPFAHPGENARRRDPRKYHYSCVPCPDFRKGDCRRGDACEYAHGVFECWLHPAQYRTRLCKDETNCARRVCFFAHKPEELRSLYPSMGSAIASPRSMGLDSVVLSPLALNSPSVLMGTSPLSPAVGAGWQLGSARGLQGSRLRAALSARNLTLEDLAELEGRQQLLDDLAALASASSATALSAVGKFRNIHASGTQSANIEDVLVADLLSQMGLADSTGFDHNSVMSAKTAAAAIAQMQSAVLPSLNYGVPSPVRASSPHLGINLVNVSSSPMMSPAFMNSSRSAAFARRSQSFCNGGVIGLSSPTSVSKLSGWSSPSGKLDWVIQGEELNKLRKSASFGIRSSGPTTIGRESMADELDVSWVQSLVKEGPVSHGLEGVNQDGQQGSAAPPGFAPWVDQLYMEPEQMVA